MVRVLHLTDPHGNVDKLKAAVDYANSNDEIKAVVITGDFLDRELPNGGYASQAIYQKVLLENYKNCKPELQKMIVEYVGLQQKVMPVIDVMQQTGVEYANLEQVMESIPKEQRETFREYVAQFPGNFEKYQALDSILSKDEDAKKVQEAPTKAVANYLDAETAAVYEVLKGSKKKIIANHGNHDPWGLEQKMPGVHFVDRQGPAKLEDILIYGTPSTYEAVNGINHEAYQQLGFYGFEGVPVEENPEYKRLKAEIAKHGKPDVMLTHVGLKDRLEKDTMIGSNREQVMYQIMKEYGVKLNLSGHFHEENHGVADGILNLNPGTENFYEIEMVKTKDGVVVEFVDVHDYVSGPEQKTEEPMRIHQMPKRKETKRAA